MGKKELSGEWLVFFGALCWSLNAPLIKFIDMDPLLVCGLRSLIATVALLPFLRPKKLNFSPWTALYLVSYTCLCISVIVSLKLTSAAIAIGMQYTALVWLFFVAILQKKPFRWKGFLPVLFIMAGVVFFMLSGGDAGNKTGNIIALTEGIFFACLTVSSKKASGSNPIGLTAIGNLFAFLFIFIFLSPSFSDLSVISIPNWGIMLILGVVQVGGGYAFYNLGVNKTTAQKASILALWELILGTVWVAIFLHEYPNTMVLSGFVIIIIGIILDSIWSTSSKSVNP